MRDYCHIATLVLSIATMSVGMSPDKNIVASVETVQYARSATEWTGRLTTVLFLAADVAVCAHTFDAYNFK